MPKEFPAIHAGASPRTSINTVRSAKRAEPAVARRVQRRVRRHLADSLCGLCHCFTPHDSASESRHA
jgi:hypothetical protein